MWLLELLISFRSRTLKNFRNILGTEFGWRTYILKRWPMTRSSMDVLSQLLTHPFHDFSREPIQNYQRSKSFSPIDVFLRNVRRDIEKRGRVVRDRISTSFSILMIFWERFNALVWGKSQTIDNCFLYKWEYLRASYSFMFGLYKQLKTKIGKILIDQFDLLSVLLVSINRGCTF